MAPAAAALAADRAVAELLRDASIEVSPRNPEIAAQLADRLAPGAQVFINFLPGTHYAPTIRLAAALRRAGFAPVPHLSARSFVSAQELAETLARLQGEAQVERVLAIGGDIAVPRGAFASSLALIATGLLPAHGIKAVGLAAYPEGHHTLPAEAVAKHAAEKRAALRAQGLAPFFVTQFCFEAAPILHWLEALRGTDRDTPVRVGIAGPASLRTLLTFAMKCGIGTSLRVLLNQPQSIGRLLRDGSPDELVRELAQGLMALPAGERPALHLFPFGGVAKTLAWRRRLTA